MDILEGAGHVSTTALMVIGIIGLKQLSISRESAKNNAQRDALKFTTEKIDFYLSDILPAQAALNRELKSRNISFFEETRVEIINDSFKFRFPKGMGDIKRLTGVESQLSDLMNSMEAFAIPFTCKLANEEVAFSAAGRDFCATVKKLAPIFYVEANKGYFKNTLKLFFIWNDRLEAEALTAEKSDIEKRLSMINNEVINPLGS